MSHRIKFALLFSIAFLVFVNHKAYTQVISYSNAVDRIAFAIGDKLSANAPVAIFDFNSSSEQFSNRIINDLTEVLIRDGVRVIDRQNLEYILSEQNFQLSGYVSDESAVSIGKMLGAQFIIVGSGENMVDYYYVQFRMLSVETAAVESQIFQNIAYDSTVRRLLNVSGSNGVGDTRFAVGARIGGGLGFNSAHKDMVGSILAPKEESNFIFTGALFFKWRITDRFGIQPEINLTVNNGLEYADSVGAHQGSFSYNSLDIPVLLYFKFIHSPVSVSVSAAPYLSIPVSKMNVNISGVGNTSVETTGIVLGVLGGVSVGFPVGPGNIIGDIRYLNDFSDVKINYNGRTVNSFLRRSVNVTIGYELSL